MRKHFRRLYSLGGLILLFGLAGAVPPASAASNISGAVVQSYSAGPSVLPSMAVELKPKAPSTVIPLTSQDAKAMLGVVVPASDAAIVLTPPSVSTQQVLVAASGRYDLLVSNQNGSIKSGDYLSVSALDGIAMKAGPDQPEAIGRAAGNFDGRDNVIGTESLKGSLGRTATVSIGHIPVDVSLAPNPLFQTASSLPRFLNKAADSVANKPVSPARVYLSSFVLLVTMVIAGSMFYGGVRSGIVAVGRNPLAKKEIGRSLIEIVLAGLMIFIAGVLAVYLILNL